MATTGPRRKLCIRREIAIAASTNPMAEWPMAENRFGHSCFDMKQLPNPLRISIDTMVPEVEGRKELTKGRKTDLDSNAEILVGENAVAAHAGSYSFDYRLNLNAKTGIERIADKHYLVSLGTWKGLKNLALFNQVAEAVVQELCPEAVAASEGIDDSVSIKGTLKSAFITYITNLSRLNWAPKDVMERQKQKNIVNDIRHYSHDHLISLDDKLAKRNPQMALGTYFWCRFGAAEAVLVSPSGGYDRTVFENSLDGSYLPDTDGESFFYADMSREGKPASMQKFAEDYRNDPSIILQMEELPLIFLAKAIDGHVWDLREKMTDEQKESPELQKLLLKKDCLSHIEAEYRLPEMLLADFRKNPADALQHLPERTPEMFLEACRLEGGCLNYVPNEQKTPEIYMAAVQENGSALQYVPRRDRTPELCLMAVQKNGYALSYVPTKLRTPELCLAAVQQDGSALEYVPSKLKTAELCLAAVQQNGHAVTHVPKELQTPELFLTAFAGHSYLDLNDIPKALRTKEIMQEIARRCPMVINDLPEEYRTAELLMIAILNNDNPFIPDDIPFAPFEVEGESISTLKEFAEKYEEDSDIVERLRNLPVSVLVTAAGNWNCRQYMTDEQKALPEIQKKLAQTGCLDEIPEEMRTQELCEMAVKGDAYALRYVPENLKTPELCLAAVLQDGGALEYVPNKLKTPELCLVAVQNGGLALEFVPTKLITPELCLAAVNNGGGALEYVPNKLKTPELCLAAVQQEGSALDYVPNKLKTPELCATAVNDSTYAMQYVPNAMKTPEIWMSAARDRDYLEEMPKKLVNEELFINLMMDVYDLEIDEVPEKFRTPLVYMAGIVSDKDDLEIPEDMECPYPYVMNATADNDDEDDDWDDDDEDDGEFSHWTGDEVVEE